MMVVRTYIHNYCVALNEKKNTIRIFRTLLDLISVVYIYYVSYTQRNTIYFSCGSWHKEKRKKSKEKTETFIKLKEKKITEPKTYKHIFVS